VQNIEYLTPLKFVKLLVCYFLMFFVCFSVLVFSCGLKGGIKQKEDVDGDQGTTSKDLVQVPIGSLMRARAKKFKDVLNGLIQEL
jgi:hypothetical protein